jgi:hypothetical protein
LFGLAGIAHTTAVISLALREGKPYDFRLVSLLDGAFQNAPGLSASRQPAQFLKDHETLLSLVMTLLSHAVRRISLIP